MKGRKEYEKIGVPAEALKASTDQFNESLKNGNDPFGRQVFDKEFGDGPFYAGLSNPYVHHTMGGVKINTDTQVISTTGDPIPNLYAAGEVAGGIHGSNRLGGNAVSEVVAMGRLTGINAAKQVDNVA